MSARVPVLVVSLPATSVAPARAQAAAAFAAGADLAEIRFDRWSATERGSVPELFPSPLPLVATLRSCAEGGAGPDDPTERERILLELARWPFRWIDVEAARDGPLLARLPDPENLGRIVSTHVVGEVDVGAWARLLREPVPVGCVRKVVASSSIGRLLGELLPRLPRVEEALVAAMTTGASGPLLRAWGQRLGLPIVYASLPEEGPGGGSPPVEPGQVPVDRLRRYFAAREAGPIFGVAGHPVAHSHSPWLHSRWMRDSGRPGIYVPLDFSSEAEFVEALGPLADRGFRGINVTHPFKEAALAAASDVRPGAAACGVANCLTLRGTEVEAENTDLLAVLRRLRELAEAGRWDGQSLTVVGTGGAARATLAAARTLGVERRVLGRDPASAANVARAFGATALSPADRRSDGLVVHATPVGRADAGPLGLDLERLLRPGGHLLDWVYAPDRPSVAEAAGRVGASYEDGRRLLVYQAAASFARWWGEDPDPESLRATLEEERCTA